MKSSARKVETLHYPNGVMTTNTYDALGRRMSTATRNAQGSNLVSFAYTYDNADQRTSVTREDARIIQYEYDAIGQLTYASGGVYQYGYQYDETGNPLLQDKSGLIVSNAFNSLNQSVASEFSGGLSVWGSKQGPLPTTVSVNSIVAQPWGLTGWNVRYLLWWTSEEPACVFWDVAMIIKHTCLLGGGTTGCLRWTRYACHWCESHCARYCKQGESRTSKVYFFYSKVVLLSIYLQIRGIQG